MGVETMNDEIKSLPPVEVKLSWWNRIKLFFMVVLSYILLAALFFTVIHIFTYYVYNIFYNGFFDPETLKYGVMIAVGSYICLIIDKDRIYESLNVKRDLPFITTNQIKK